MPNIIPPVAFQDYMAPLVVPEEEIRLVEGK